MKKITLVLATLFLVASVTNCVSLYSIKSGNKGKVTVVKNGPWIFSDEYSCDVTAQDDLNCANIEGSYVNNPSLGAKN
ncbi:hypothetical protein EHQ31_10645 [Leptospira montravelensis]|uniref:Lipoprotein n=1 Tax=Leptospira montravelensis TaxID=2484961 RepID=A0ABY2LRS6_9LEPT|nr:hypothetical protein [Leptospira montravelensis]TGK81148.1 hypothetical protein EHQ19_16175 [Leptospira montravelensis]TGL01252.1 hypothetical protein EHQ31_10645 [Leptospira montravelensis]